MHTTSRAQCMKAALSGLSGLPAWVLGTQLGVRGVSQPAYLLCGPLPLSQEVSVHKGPWEGAQLPARLDAELEEGIATVEEVRRLAQARSCPLLPP